MEEHIGGLWHRLITRSAERSYPAAAVRLVDIEKMAGVLFRAFGGDAGLRVAPAAEVNHGARRGLLQRIAASGERAALAALDAETLRLPQEIALFPDRDLNRDLYLWLIALAAGDPSPAAEWIVRNQQATLAVLEIYPGLQGRYRRLVAAVLALRHDPAHLPAAEAAQEQAIRAALTTPGSVTTLPPAAAKSRPPQPVPLWLYPTPLSANKATRLGTPAEPTEAPEDSARFEDESKKRLAAERVDSPEGKGGLMLMFRAESLLTWAEYIKVDRQLDDDPDPQATEIAEDMDKLSIARDDRRVASKIRFDLDLPSAALDDEPIGPGIKLPEWDYKKRLLHADHCSLQVLASRHVAPLPIPPHLAKAASRLRAQFAALIPSRRWLKGQPDGSELDLDACVRAHADRCCGVRGLESGTYLAQVRRERDLACLVLADLSLSTDAYVSDTQRVIDVIRDSLMLFTEALGATGDRFGVYGFSSLKRGNIRFHPIKEFDQRVDDLARGRIAAIKPGYYTRMGAAIRHSTSILAQQPSAVKLLLLLSDGKPNDLDHYEGRYGIEDTRMALIEARNIGLRPFCVTIDREGSAYLPHLFGPNGYTIIRKPEELPSRLPLLYAQLTQT